MRRVIQQGLSLYHVSALAILFFLSACVETADCDQTTPCPNLDTEVCYNFRCLPRCTLDAPTCSDENRQCRPCQDACPGDAGYACVLDNL